MRTDRIRQTAWVLALIFISVSFANADTYIKQTRRTDPFTMMGQAQPEKIETIVTWLGKDRARIDSGQETSMIVLSNKKLAYMLNHKDHTYMEMPLNMQEAVTAMTSKEESEEAKRAAMMYQNMAQSMMQGMSIKVTPTSQTQKIKNWTARKYQIEMSMPMGGASKSDAWATEDIKVDSSLYWMAANANMSGQKGFEKVTQEMQKIKGFIVLKETRSQAMGTEIKTTEEVVELAEKNPPSGLFDIPKGYSKTEGFMP